MAMLKNSLLAALVKAHCCLNVVVSGHVKENREISFTKGGTESGWPFSGSSWQIMLHIAICRPTCLEPLLNCQCCFKFWGCGYSYT